MIRYFSLTLFSFLTLLISCTKKNQDNNTSRKQNVLAVDGFIVKQSFISEKVEVPGSLLPFEETQIRAEVGGKVIKLNIQEGTSVAKGALLVKLFDADLQALLKKLQIQLKIKEKTAERNRELLEINGISQEDYDLSTLDVENIKADIETTQIAISKTEIRAPYAGTVGLRYISLGSYISPADVITTIRQIDQLKLEFSIPEKYAKEIRPGYVIKFMVDGGSKIHEATVMATENSVDQNTRTLRLRALVNGKNPELVSGSFAKINLQLGKNNKAMMVPTQSVIPTARNKQVIVVRKDSALFTIVETGIRDSAYLQILNGIKPGDTIVTTGIMSVRPNSKIRVVKINSL